MAALSRDKQQSGTVGCREYSSILGSSETAPCFRASARVLVRGVARKRYVLAKERVRNAGSRRASERLSTENTDASLVVLPTAGTPPWHLADFRHFFETREKMKIRTKSTRTGRATATRRRRQAAARLAFHCAHCFCKRFSEPPPRLVPGRRASCVDRVPSASKKEAVETTRGLNRPGVSARRSGPARALTPSSTAQFPMKRIFKCIRGILPCRLSNCLAATPPSRPTQCVGIYTSQLRMVHSQAERRYAKHSLAHPCECPERANRVHVFQKIKNSGVYPASHRATCLCTSRRRRHHGLPSARA